MTEAWHLYRRIHLIDTQIIRVFAGAFLTKELCEKAAKEEAASFGEAVQMGHVCKLQKDARSGTVVPVPMGGTLKEFLGAMGIAGYDYQIVNQKVKTSDLVVPSGPSIILKH